MNLQQFFDGMTSSVETEITITNLERDRINNRWYPSDTFEQFIEKITNSTVTSAEEAFKQVCSSFHHHGHQITYDGMLVRVLAMTQYATWIAEDLETNPEDLAYHFGRMKKEGELLISGSIGPDVTWVTCYDAIAEDFANLPNAPDLGSYHPKVKIADEIRNLLGLTKIDFHPIGGEPVYAVWIGYYAKLPAQYTLLNPTVFDADGRWIFRSSGNNADWGITVNLRTLEDSKPEAVHKGFLIEPNHQMKVYPLGRIDQYIEFNTIYKRRLLSMI